MKQPAIQIDRKWVGAPNRAWTPTSSLFVIAVGGYALLAAALVEDALSFLVGVPLLALAIYLGFTVLHDAMHGTAHRSRAVGNAMGRVCGLLLLVPLPLFRGVHHAHHGHANEPGRDPDLFVAYGPAWLRPLTLLTAVPVYRWHFYRQRLWRDRAGLYETLATEGLLLGMLLGAALLGVFGWVLWLWLIPASLAALFLALAFDYLPHYPHLEQGRYYDTRIYPGRIANVLLLGQNYHLIHHLWTTIPWYRYQQVFRDLEPELRARNCPIGWTSLAVAPARGAEEASAFRPEVARRFADLID